MKMIRNLTIFTCLLASNLASANNLNDSVSKRILGSTSKVTSYEEISRLKSQEALLKAILKNSELIQLKDGSVIDFRDLEDFQPTKGQNHNLNGLLEVFRAVEGGGTGAGG